MVSPSLEPFRDKMRRHLVFNTRPDFIGINKRQRGFSAPGPTAQQQARLMSHGIAGTLRIGMLAEVGFEIMLKDSLQITSGHFHGKRSVDSVEPGHPVSDDPVGEAPLAVLIFRALPLQEPLHFAAVIIDLGHQGSE